MCGTAGGELDGGASTWIGSLTSLLLRVLFNVSITVNNVVVKYVAPSAVATLTCQSLHIRTATDAWQTEVAVKLSPVLQNTAGLITGHISNDLFLSLRWSFLPDG